VQERSKLRAHLGGLCARVREERVRVPHACGDAAIAVNEAPELAAGVQVKPRAQHQMRLTSHGSVAGG
jgi:hypothetical protein